MPPRLGNIGWLEWQRTSDYHPLFRLGALSRGHVVPRQAPHERRNHDGEREDERQAEEEESKREGGPPAPQRFGVRPDVPTGPEPRHVAIEARRSMRDRVDHQTPNAGQ